MPGCRAVTLSVSGEGLPSTHRPPRQWKPDATMPLQYEYIMYGSPRLRIIHNMICVVVSSTILYDITTRTVDRRYAVCDLFATAIYAPTCRSTTSEGEEEQGLALEHWSILIKDLFHHKRLFSHLDKLHVGAATLLEAKVDNGILIERKQVFECLHQQRESRLKVDALSSNDDIRFLVDHFLRERLTPVFIY